MNRHTFLQQMLQMATPVLSAASRGELRRIMTVEQQPGAGREPYACLEAVARLLTGMAPWFAADITDKAEAAERDRLLAMAHQTIAAQVDPASEDFADYTHYGNPYSQLLVDTAFLAQAILRAPTALWDPLPDQTKANVIHLLAAARNITPYNSNWLLFSTEVEILYRKLTGQCRLHVIQQHFQLIDTWYVGDGWYMDGPHFATDYYNSLVIHPFLLDLCDEAADLLPHGTSQKVLTRAQRHAEVLEKLVATDGTYIAMGRSLTYRCGVFHLLAQLAWQNRLPASINATTARDILFTVATRTLGPASYRADGFLNIGICSHQPHHAQRYICTGSLYMAAAAFLPLGIADTDDFWQLPPVPWTQRAVWL